MESVDGRGSLFAVVATVTLSWMQPRIEHASAAALKLGEALHVTASAIG